MSPQNVTTQLFDLESRTVGDTVPMSVLLPPGFDPAGPSLPLLIYLHGGGGDRTHLVESAPLYQRMFDQGLLPPVVVVSFSSGPGSFYYGAWEKFVVEELPEWAASKFNVRTDRDGTLMTGISMGGYGSLKIGLKYPGRFCAIAPMEPAIEPTLTWTEGPKRNNWYRGPGGFEAVWGSPFDPEKWLADNPANIARHNAAAIRESGIAIYLEVGDQDFINLHDGAEFLHRVLWDNDVRHEYHLVRWADHVGVSLERRMLEAHAFLAAALGGGLSEPIDLPLTEEKAAFTEWTFGGADAGRAAAGLPARRLWRTRAVGARCTLEAAARPGARRPSHEARLRGAAAHEVTESLGRGAITLGWAIPD